MCLGCTRYPGASKRPELVTGLKHETSFPSGFIIKSTDKSIVYAIFVALKKKAA